MKVQNSAKLSSILCGDFVGGEVTRYLAVGPPFVIGRFGKVRAAAKETPKTRGNDWTPVR